MIETRTVTDSYPAPCCCGGTGPCLGLGCNELPKPYWNVSGYPSTWDVPQQPPELPPAGDAYYPYYGYFATLLQNDAQQLIGGPSNVGQKNLMPYFAISTKFILGQGNPEPRFRYEVGYADAIGRDNYQTSLGLQVSCLQSYDGGSPELPIWTLYELLQPDLFGGGIGTGNTCNTLTIVGLVSKVVSRTMINGELHTVIDNLTIRANTGHPRFANNVGLEYLAQDIRRNNIREQEYLEVDLRCTTYSHPTFRQTFRRNSNGTDLLITGPVAAPQDWVDTGAKVRVLITL
jgi:hypothetical protein